MEKYKNARQNFLVILTYLMMFQAAYSALQPIGIKIGQKLEKQVLSDKYQEYILDYNDYNAEVKGKYFSIRIKEEVQSIINTKEFLFATVSTNSLQSISYNYTYILDNYKNLESLSDNFIRLDIDNIFRKEMQLIKFPPLKENGKLYITFLKYPSDLTNTIKFDVEIQTFNNDFCFSECQGQCSQSFQCSCNTESQFGYQCRQYYEFIPINLSKKGFQPENQKWTYFKTQIQDNEKGVQVEIVKTSNVSTFKAGISFYFPKSSQFTQPNFVDQYLEMPSDQQKNSFILYQKHIANYIPQGESKADMIIGIYPQGQIQGEYMYIQVFEVKTENKKYKSDVPEWALYLFTILVICGILFMIIVVCAIVRGSINYERARNRQRILPQEQDKLSVQIIQKYLPEQQYKDITDEKVKVDECTICLVEFSAEESVRVSMCNHLFHKDCIDEWLLRHQNCPNCRREHKEKDFKEEFKKLNPNSDLNNEIEQIINPNNQSHATDSSESSSEDQNQNNNNQNNASQGDSEDEEEKYESHTSRNTQRQNQDKGSQDEEGKEEEKQENKIYDEGQFDQSVQNRGNLDEQTSFINQEQEANKNNNTAILNKDLNSKKNNHRKQNNRFDLSKEGVQDKSIVNIQEIEDIINQNNQKQSNKYISSLDENGIDNLQKMIDNTNQPIKQGPNKQVIFSNQENINIQPRGDI